MAGPLPVYVFLLVEQTAHTYVFNGHLPHIWSDTQYFTQVPTFLGTNNSLWFTVEGFPGLVAHSGSVYLRFLSLDCLLSCFGVLIGELIDWL